MLAGCDAAQPEQTVKPRTVVLTDGEVDDYDSFIRLLLYSNEMDIAGIVLTASQWHWEGDGQGTPLLPENRWEGPREGMSGPQFSEPKESQRWIGREWIPDLIDAYGQCYDNLLKHDAGYPSPEYLHSVVKVGNVRVEGDMAAPTEGSEYVKDLLLDDDPSPLYLQVWGGTNTVARALLSIEEQYKDTPEWESVYRRVSDKAFLYIIQDQDGTYRNYIEGNWPEIRTVYNGTQFFGFAYLWKQAAPREMQDVLKGAWFRENIVNGHGPLTAKYLGAGIPFPFVDPEDHYGDPESVLRNPSADFNDFISEGDSPSYFHLFDFLGLRSLEHPEWGGIGGRFNEIRPHFWKDPMPAGGFSPFGRRGRPGEPPAEPKVSFDRAAGDFNPFSGEVDLFYPQMRWTEVLQNDFAARADWCVKGYAGANHAPVASVKGALDRETRPGQKVTLKGSATDPDGDAVSLNWWQYREAGTSDAELALEGASGATVSFVVPTDAKSGETFHIILEAKDDGVPALRHFQRVILTVK
jgi:hypothetical protein